MKVLIIIPARNEAMSVGDVVAESIQWGWSDILVVNDDSGDDTSLIAAGRGARVMNLPVNLGAWGAIQAGFRYALHWKYDAVVTMDADGQHDARYISSLLDALGDNTIVTGVSPGRVGWIKKMIWRLLGVLSGLSGEDLTSGFRAYPRDALEVMVGHEGMLMDYQDVGVLLLCRTRGFSLVQVPVHMHSRSHGSSRIFRNYFEILRYLLSTVYLIGAKRW